MLLLHLAVVESSVHVETVLLLGGLWAPTTYPHCAHAKHGVKSLIHFDMSCVAGNTAHVPVDMIYHRQLSSYSNACLMLT